MQRSPSERTSGPLKSPNCFVPAAMASRGADLAVDDAELGAGIEPEGIVAADAAAGFSRRVDPGEPCLVLRLGLDRLLGGQHLLARPVGALQGGDRSICPKALEVGIAELGVRRLVALRCLRPI